MKNLSLEKIAEACHGRLVFSKEQPEKEVEDITIDSRTVKVGSLFVAIKGERVDGHAFLKDVFEKGAMAALVEDLPEELPGPCIQVASCLQAIKDLAEFYLQGLDLKVVGITGSVGKTSTKEMIAQVLSEKYQVLATAGNFNNEIGLPLTIFRIRDEHEVAVLEMGISDFGEMSRLAKIARPDIAVITNIGICHLENLKTRDGILKAKTEIFDYMKEDGLVVLNGDDDKLSTVKEVKGRVPYFFSLEEKQASVYATKVESLGLDGMKASICTECGSFEAKIQIPGIHNVQNALAATQIGLLLGLSLDEIKSGIEKAKTIKGRTNLIHCTDGKIVIDDCYNANPVSMKEALNVLDLALGRKIAVLGDMGELGTNEAELHYEVGEHLAGTQIDVVFCAGTLMKELADAVEKYAPEKQIFYFKEKEEMKKELYRFTKAGDAILVKASHFMGFEEIVSDLQKSK